MATGEGISAVILAGGRGSRVAGRDKGLLDLDGKPLIEHVIEQIAPQVDELIISANRNLERYRSYGFHVVTDADDSFSGPLAGIAAAMSIAKQPLLLTLPCDAPKVASDLLTRLAEARAASDADLAVAHDGERWQSLHALVSVRCFDSLQEYLARGDKKVQLWQQQQNCVVVDFSGDRDLFWNLNVL